MGTGVVVFVTALNLCLRTVKINPRVYRLTLAKIFCWVLYASSSSRHVCLIFFSCIYNYSHHIHPDDEQCKFHSNPALCAWLPFLQHCESLEGIFFFFLRSQYSVCEYRQDFSILKLRFHSFKCMLIISNSFIVWDPCFKDLTSITLLLLYAYEHLSSCIYVCTTCLLGAHRNRGPHKCING